MVDLDVDLGRQVDVGVGGFTASGGWRVRWGEVMIPDALPRSSTSLPRTMYCDTERSSFYAIARLTRFIQRQ